MTLLAAFQTFLSLYRQTDILVTPIACNLAEIEGLIGLFVNTLVLRNFGATPVFSMCLESGK